MAIIECSECGHTYSNLRRNKCPSCGHRAGDATETDKHNLNHDTKLKQLTREGQQQEARALKKKIIIPATAFAAIAGGYVYATPFIAVNEIRSAIKAGNESQMNRLIDFPEIRSQLKDQFKQEIKAQYTKEMAGNPFAAFGLALIAPMVDGLVDSTISATGFKRLFAEGKLSRPDSKSGAANRAALEGSSKGPDYTMGYQGLNEFQVSLDNTQTDQTSSINFSLERKGLASWILNKIEIKGLNLGN